MADADVDPPQLTQTEIRRVRYRVRGRPREESEMLEEELSDLLACANITGPEYELGSPSLAGPSTANSGPAHRESASALDDTFITKFSHSTTEPVEQSNYRLS